MGERIVSIKLVADAVGAVTGIHAVRDAAGELKAKVADSAMSQRQEWATVGAGLTAVGVAITGVGVLALKTGIQYNTLQQTTRAALTSLLGSAAAANAQMDKLDDFARNSPFSKATFIAAQQQMLAFGIETKKVIPYLDGVQNAVAAAGGSNVEIEGIVATMSKIQSSSKITATDLIEFGNRGVNAADLIGSQMGKTGAEIRSEITAGTLDATQALDALAAGMTERFEGAADGVKNTFAGAMDRVKAAWRDFASELAKPLVDPSGGGALVDLLNWTADAMRNFEKLPEPIKATVSGLTGLVGVAALAGGAFMTLYPKFLETRAALASLGVTSGAVRGGMGSLVRFLGGPLGIALMAAAATVAVFNGAMDASKTSASEFEASIKQGTGALDAMRATAEKNEKGLVTVFADVSSQVDKLPSLLDKASSSGRGFFSSLSFNETAMLDNLKEFGAALANLSVSDLPRAQNEFAKFANSADLSKKQIALALDEMPAFKNALIDYADSSGLATDDTSLLALAMGKIGPAAEEGAAGAKSAADNYLESADAANQLSDQLMKLLDSYNELNGIGQSAEQQNAALQSSYAGLQEYVANAQAGVDGYALSLDENTAAGAANRAMLADHAASIKSNADAQFELESATLGSEQAAANYEARLSGGRQQIYDTALALTGNADAAQALTDKILAMPTAPEIKILMETAAAKSKIDDLKNYVPQVLTIQAQVEYSESFLNKFGKAAYGGTIGFAQGGTIGYASGGSVRGIGGGVAGGTVYGRGGSKSDSITVNLSRGEEVIQEPYASMYRTQLKQMNRGDFVAGQPQPQVIVVSGGAGAADVKQYNNVTMLERDPRLLMRQFGRELKGVIQ